MTSACCHGNVFEEQCAIRISLACILRLGKHARVVHRAKHARRSGIHIWQRWRTRRQSRRRCNSQEGSEAKRLSVEVAYCSNSQRETGGIKLLQTITFNEKVNATNQGLARTWMQMCRRRVISKQSSPPTYRLLFLLLLLLLLILHIVAAFLPVKRIERNEATLLSDTSLFICRHARKYMKYMEYDLPGSLSTTNRFLSTIENEYLSTILKSQL